MNQLTIQGLIRWLAYEYTLDYLENPGFIAMTLKATFPYISNIDDILYEVYHSLGLIYSLN